MGAVPLAPQESHLSYGKEDISAFQEGNYTH